MDATFLWQQFQQGDKNAFNRLFKLHYADLKAYGMKIVNRESIAKEGIQLLFVKLWEKRHTLPVVTSIKSYLFRAYRRTLLDLLQAENRRRKTPVPAPTFTISAEESLLFQQYETAQFSQLSFLLSQLPSKQKEIIYLRFYNRLSYLDIADITGLSYQSVRNYGAKAIQFLRSNWKKV
ncbi:MAG: sigma-70 family RNA polymerase sigma factor [Bacteroidota bacterium]